MSFWQTLAALDRYHEARSCIVGPDYLVPHPDVCNPTKDMYVAGVQAALDRTKVL